MEQRRMIMERHLMRLGLEGFFTNQYVLSHTNGFPLLLDMYLTDGGRIDNSMNNTNQTISMSVAEAGNMEALALCWNRGADLTKKDDDGLTVLAYAARGSHLHIVKWLVEEYPKLLGDGVRINWAELDRCAIFEATKGHDKERANETLAYMGPRFFHRHPYTDQHILNAWGERNKDHVMPRFLVEAFMPAARLKLGLQLMPIIPPTQPQHLFPEIGEEEEEYKEIEEEEEADREWCDMVLGSESDE